MKKIIFLLLIIALVAMAFLVWPKEKHSEIVRSSTADECLDKIIQDRINFIMDNNLDVKIAGKSLGSFGYDVKISEDAKILTPESFLEDIIGCSVSVYQDGIVEVDRAEAELRFEKDEVENIDDEIYVPISDYSRQLGYDIELDLVNGVVNFVNIDDGGFLPKAYDMREHGRVTPVRDQGVFGTCWAFAALGALETVTMPEEENIYSVDHMSRNNGFSLDLSEGGEHTMSLAYMASWHGPVLDKDDEYGDGVTDDTLKAVKHLKEAIIIEDRNREKIKSAIYKYGGVETSVYMEMSYGDFDSDYYNKDTYSYYYNGDKQPNHDLVIVGWDDEYSKENFSVEPSSDGAYICKNSWGESFGDKGYFYISYEDVNICSKSIVYTKLARPDNYDNIYQTDLLGWVGQMGFSNESAYFANVYTAEKDEILKAVSFYATGPDTKFSVFIVTDYEDDKSLNGGRKQIGKGETRYAGYYTVDLTQEIDLSKGQKYAIIVSIKTPNSERPIAIECDGGERTASLDLTDGEGYISLYGEVWYRAEDSDSNVCLKAFTDDR